MNRIVIVVVLLVVVAACGKPAPEPTEKRWEAIGQALLQEYPDAGLPADAVAVGHAYDVALSNDRARQDFLSRALKPDSVAMARFVELRATDDLSSLKRCIVFAFEHGDVRESLMKEADKARKPRRVLFVQTLLAAGAKRIVDDEAAMDTVVEHSKDYLRRLEERRSR